jgi:MFS family permease
VLSDYLDWRWVFFVNLPIGAVVLAAVFRLLPSDRRRQEGSLDAVGAVLITAAMLVLVYTIVEAPDRGWGSARTVGGLLVAGVLLLTFAVFEIRIEHPLFPFSIFRIKGLGEADLTQTVAMAGFYSMFLFATLYMQNVLGYSQIKTGLIYLPVTLGVAVGAGIATQLVPRVGTRPLIVAGALLGAGAIFWLSRIPLHGHYWANLFGPLQIMSIGLGALFVGVTTAAQAGVPEEQAGLAAAMINASAWLGGALGIAVFSAIGTSRTNHRLAHGASTASALTTGFRAAFLASAIAILAAALIAFRSRNATAADLLGAPADPGDGELLPETAPA